MNINSINTSEQSGYTIAPVAAPANVATPILPEFIRYPRPSTLCPWTGLSRSKMWEVLQTSRGKVKTVSLRKEGALKGARLIHLKSLLTYLHSLAEGGEE